MENTVRNLLVAALLGLSPKAHAITATMNSMVTGDSANTPQTVVYRDTNGNFVTGGATFQGDTQYAGSTVPFAAAQTINWNTQGPRVTVVVTANTTSSTWSNPAQRGMYILNLVQGGAGSYTYTWPANIVWPSQGTAPTLSTAVSARDYFALYYDTDLKWHVLAEALNN